MTSQVVDTSSCNPSTLKSGKTTNTVSQHYTVFNTLTSLTTKMTQLDAI